MGRRGRIGDLRAQLPQLRHDRVVQCHRRRALADWRPTRTASQRSSRRGRNDAPGTVHHLRGPAAEGMLRNFWSIDINGRRACCSGSRTATPSTFTSSIRFENRSMTKDTREDPIGIAHLLRGAERLARIYVSAWAYYRLGKCPPNPQSLERGVAPSVSTDSPVQ
jgi:hypothetical protein